MSGLKQGSVVVVIHHMGKVDQLARKVVRLGVSSLLMIYPVAAGLFMQYITVIGENPVAVLNRDMRPIGEEFPDQLLIIRHINTPI